MTIKGQEYEIMCGKVKVKVGPSGYCRRARGSEYISVPVRMNAAIDCRYFTPSPRLPSQPRSRLWCELYNCMYLKVHDKSKYMYVVEFELNFTASICCAFVVQ